MHTFIKVLPLEVLTNKLFCRVLQALQQEELMNVFFDDWKALGTGAEADDWSGKVSEGLMLYQAFTDQKHTKDKKISSINWHPTIYGKLRNPGQGTASSTRFEPWEFLHPKILTKRLQYLHLTVLDQNTQ